MHCGLMWWSVSSNQRVTHGGRTAKFNVSLGSKVLANPALRYFNPLAQTGYNFWLAQKTQSNVLKFDPCVCYVCNERHSVKVI